MEVVLTKQAREPAVPRGRLRGPGYGRAVAGAALVGGLSVTACSGTASTQVSPPTASAAADPAPATTGTSPTAVTTPARTPKPVTVERAVRLVVAVAPWRLPVAMSRTVALTSSSGSIELLGGLLNGDHSSSARWRIALPGSKVTADGSLVLGVHDSAGAVVRGHLTLFGGGASREVSMVQRADPGTASASVGQLPQPRSDLVAVALLGRVIVLGGYDGQSSPADILSTTDGSHFRVVGRLPVPVRYPAVCVRGSTVLVYGGDVNRRPVDTIQSVDVRTGRATIVGHLPQPLSHEAAFSLGGVVWLAGGTTPSGTSARIYRSTDGWSFRRSGDLPGPRSDAGSTVVGNVGYLIGGETPTRTRTVVTLTASSG